MPGPIPNRSDQRRRVNKPTVPISKSPGAHTVSIPPADKRWHPIASRWYKSLIQSGQSAYYEPSDWAQALYIAEAMSRNLANARFSAQLFMAVLNGSTELMTTEGARRRLRLELQRGNVVDEDEDASVSALSEYRKKLGA